MMLISLHPDTKHGLLYHWTRLGLRHCDECADRTNSSGYVQRCYDGVVEERRLVCSGSLQPGTPAMLADALAAGAAADLRGDTLRTNERG